MDFRLPSSAYSEGAVVFDTSPLAQMSHQYAMRAMARDEALDDYFRNLNKSINPEGVRNQDIEGLTKKQGEWQQFYMQNKQAIKNPRLDNGKALTEYQSRLQDMKNYIQQSKNATDISADLAKARLDPNKSFMFEDDEVINKIGTHDKPLTDPDHKTLNIQELSIQPKPIDVKEWQAMQKSAAAGLKPSEEVSGIDVDPQTMDTITTIKKKYSPEDLQAAGNRMKSLYQLDRRVRHSADKNLLNAPNAAELNEVYKSAYGKNAETPADLLAAQTILGLQTEGTVQKRTAGSLAQKKFMEGLKQRNRTALAELRYSHKQMDKQQEGLWLGEYMGRMVDDAQKSGKKYQYKYANGTTVEEAEIPVDKISAQVLSRKIGGKDIEPDYIRITADGKIRPIFFEYDDEGKPKKSGDRYAVDELLSQPISMEQFKVNLSKPLLTGKQRAAEMGGQQSGSGQTPASGTQKMTAEEIKAKFKISYD